MLSKLKIFFLSDEKINVSFLLKNTIQMIFLISIIALVESILLRTDNSDERLIAAYVYVFLGGLIFLGLVQLFIVFLNSNKNIFIIAYFMLYSIMMLSGIYVVQLIIRLQ